MKITRLVKARISRFLGSPVNERRYIDYSLGVSGFLENLKKNSVNYVALRWFDDLPDVAPGEDIDILVADEDVELLTSFVTHNRTRKATPCNIDSALVV